MENKINMKTDNMKYSKELIEEIESIIENEELSCSIDEFQDKVHWDWISYKQKLSEKFIEKFQDKVYWYRISYYQKLSEEFIEKFQNKVDWYAISYSQKLSDGFIEKFKLYITKFKIKFKRKLHHGKYFYGTQKAPIRRAFFINDKQYGEQII